MSNIFKFYINNNNTFNEVYLFIKNKYIVSKSNLPSIDELNSNYANYNSFIYSEIYENHFNNDFNHYDLMYLKTYNTKLIFLPFISFLFHNSGFFLFCFFSFFIFPGFASSSNTINLKTKPRN